MLITIDREGCISCGACAGACPEIFQMDDEDKASVREKYRKGGPEAGEVQDDLSGCAEGASEGCPVSVIHIG